MAVCISSRALRHIAALTDQYLTKQQALSWTRGYEGCRSFCVSAVRTLQHERDGPKLHARLYSTFPPHQVLGMPALSPTMESGSLIAWKVKEGDEVRAGEELADIQTDKAALSFENQEDGFVAKLLVPDGTQDIPVGMPVAVLVDEQDLVPAFANFQATKDTAASPSTNEQPAAEAAAPQQSPSVPASSKMGPAARMALLNANLSPADVQPTGPQGIITKGDVMAAVSSGANPSPVAAAPKPAPTSTPATSKSKATASTATAASSADLSSPRLKRGERYKDVPVSNMRRVIAKRLLQSKVETPAIYVTGSAKLGPLTTLRAALKSAGMKASVNDFVIKAVAMALRAVPGACAGWDAKAEEVTRFPKVDVSVAVATEGGLITPIVTDADTRRISEIGSAMKDLAGRARENKLAPHEFTGGSFTISNLGMFGVKEFSAIINPPQSCILAVGGPQERVVEEKGKMVSESYMNVRLSADNRVVDEETAAEFLDSFQFHIENPALLMA